MHDPRPRLDVRAPRHDRPRPALLGWWWPMACAAATSGLLFLLTRSAGLVNDDILNLQQHRHGELVDLLLFPVFLTQVSPGHRLLTELQLQVGPTDRVVMHALIAIMAGTCVLVAARIATRLGGATWWVPGVLALVVAGPAGLAIALWYAAAYHLVPALLAGLLGVLLYVRWRGDPDGPLPRGVPLLSVLAIAVGLLFSIKAGLAVVLLLLLEYVVLQRGDLEAVVVGLWKDRRVWWSYGLLAVLYVGMSQRSGIDPVFGELPTVAVAVARGAVRMAGPMLLGIGPTSPNYTIPDLPLVVVGSVWVVLVVLGVAVARRGDAARRGLVVGVVVLLVSLTLSSGPRATFLGELAALAPRYHLEGLVYLVLVVAIGLGRTPVSSSDRRAWRDRLARITAAVGISAIVATTAWSHTELLSTSSELASGAWIAALERSLAEHDEEPRVLDGPLPPYVFGLVAGSRISELDGLVPGLDVVTTRPTAAATADGVVEPLRTEVIFEQSGGDFASNALVSLTGTSLANATQVCTSSELLVGLPLAAHPRPRVLELRTSGPGTLRLDHVASEGSPTEPAASVTTGGGDGEVVVLPLDVLGWASGIELTLIADGDPVCLDHVRILDVGNDLPDGDDAG